MTIFQKQILNEILLNTSINKFNIAINDFSLQYLYESNTKFIAPKYFGGNQTKTSVFLRELFNDFQTLENETKARKLNYDMIILKKEITLKKRFRKDATNEIKTYNSMVSEFKILNKGIEKLTRIYAKLSKV